MKIIAHSKVKFLLGASAFAGALAFGTGSVSADTYTVKSGDTLNKIAQSHNTTIEEIANQNSIQNVNLIYVDEVFNINVALPSTEEKVTEPVAEQSATQVVAQPAAQETTKVETPSVSTGDSSDAKNWIAGKESGGSYTVVNPTSGTYGKYQLQSYNLKYGTSPEGQEKAADEYVANRYGSWDNAKAFWLNHNWY